MIRPFHVFLLSPESEGLVLSAVEGQNKKEASAPTLTSILAPLATSNKE